jgi:hypothetical protein
MLFLHYFNMTAEKLPDLGHGLGKPDALDADAGGEVGRQP